MQDQFQFVSVGIRGLEVMSGASSRRYAKEATGKPCVGRRCEDTDEYRGQEGTPGFVWIIGKIVTALHRLLQLCIKLQRYFFS